MANTDNGYVILSRGMYKNSKTWQALNPVQKVIMITLIMMANHSDQQWWDEWKKEWVTVKRGQLITSLEGIRKACGKGISIQNIRTALLVLQKMGFLTNQSTKHYRVITLVNYDLYQSPDNYLTKQLTNAQQSPNKALTTNNNVNNVNNDKYIYTIFQHWNSKKIIKHRKLTDRQKRNINARLKEGYTPEEIMRAIDNYAMVLHGKEYYWTHRWSIQDFLLRGLDRFLPDNFEAASFLINKGGQAQNVPNVPVKDIDQEKKRMYDALLMS